MVSTKKKREKDKDSDRKHKRDKREKDKKSRSQSEKRPKDDELLDYALHDAVQVQQNVYEYGHGFASKYI
jgi:hypothetical protein